MPLRATSTLFAAGSAFSVDDVHSDTWQMYLRNWAIPILPSPRVSSSDIPGSVGKATMSQELSSRILSLDISALEPDRPKMHALLRAFAAANDPRSGPHRYELVDEFPGWYLNAIPTSDIQAQPTSAAVTVNFTVNLEAVDPFFYSKTAQSIDHRFPGFEQPTTLDNLGSEATPLVISVRPRVGAPGALTGFTITVAGVAVTYTGPINTGDLVVIDTGAQTVTKNGANALPRWTGDFPLLPPGESTVDWSDPGVVGGQVNFSYRERLL